MAESGGKHTENLTTSWRLKGFFFAFIGAASEISAHGGLSRQRGTVLAFIL